MAHHVMLFLVDESSSLSVSLPQATFLFLGRIISMQDMEACLTKQCDCLTA